MMNFGLSDLRLVAPRDGWPNERANVMAAGALGILQSARLFDTVREAVGDLEMVLATTARERGVAKTILTPAEAASRLRTASGNGIRTGLLFGGERAGLDNDDVSLADAVITIPTAEFASLNLGQAVLLTGYEWFKAGDSTPGERIDHRPLSVPATREDLFALFDHLEDELMNAGFMHPPDKRIPVIHNVRSMLQRAQMTDQEVRTWRGIIVALVRDKRRRNP